MSANTPQLHRKSLLFACGPLDSASFEELSSRNLKQRPRRISKCQLKKQIREEFQEQQRLRRERQLRGLVLGKGLGERAERMIFKGFYRPQMVLDEGNLRERPDGCSTTTYSNVPSFLPEISQGKAFDNSLNRTFLNSDNSGPGLRSFDSHPLSDAGTPMHLEATVSTPGCLLGNGPSEAETPQSISKFQESCAEIRDSIDNLEYELDSLCVPHTTFNSFLDVLSRALELVERGNLKEEFILTKDDFDMGSGSIGGPSEDKAPIHLVGAEEVMEYVLENMIETSFELAPVTHTAQWVLQFTITFLRSLVAITEEDAYLRLELLARCVRLLGSTEHFSATLLTFAFLIEEYNAFYELATSVEDNIGSLLSEVESMLDEVLMVDFPYRRAKLQKVDKVIKLKLQRVIMLINEVDSSWRPTIYFHLFWKDTFLSRSFFRIHNIISQRYVYCSYGFVDEALYTKIFDSRVTGRVLGTMPSQPQIVLARRVEYERVIEGLTYQQIGMSVKGHSSRVVGYQICMGARYVLRQFTPDFDKAWGFKMGITFKVPTADEMDKVISKMVARAKKRAGIAGSERQRGVMTFLTRGDN
ncbi:unnamed protein product [Phytomonas sp. EM1]|nr:unnamed protein product [Phytomonas sp. EM1]|eukprot:CCW60715.1 unnamed protein product [Phytomonas sp. isolate EM1]